MPGGGEYEEGIRLTDPSPPLILHMALARPLRGVLRILTILALHRVWRSCQPINKTAITAACAEANLFKTIATCGNRRGVEGGDVRKVG
jgi:hypothetical protein